MKATKVATQTESQIVSSMKVLTRAIETLNRIASNKDAELFKKDCIAFRSGLVGVVISKLGIYEIPKRYNDYIDTLYVGKFRSSRQAVKNSIIACFYLGMNGTNSKAYLDNAKKGKTHLEALTELEWARIKTVENKRIKDAKKERDAKKAQADVVTPTTQADVVTPTTQADVVSNTTQATTAPTVQTVKVAPNAGISKDAGIRGEALYKSLFNSESEAVLIYLARKILAELQA